MHLIGLIIRKLYFIIYNTGWPLPYLTFCLLIHELG